MLVLWKPIRIGESKGGGNKVPKYAASPPRHIMP